MLWIRTLCLNTYENRTELSNEFHVPIFMKLFALFSEGLLIWYKTSIWEGCLPVCSFWDRCSLHSGSFQQCTWELVNHSLLEWTVLSYHPGVNSCSSGSWSGCHIMYQSINTRFLHYLRYDCRKAHPPLARTSWQITKWAITAQSVQN